MTNLPAAALFSLLLFRSITAPAGGAEQNLEVFSWWTSGSEASALRALIALYERSMPGVQVQNEAITGGGGVAARPLLQTRLNSGNPPDTWQTHPGAELFGRYVDPAACSALNDIYQIEGWNQHLPPGLLKQISRDGETFAVLVGVHRGNVLWYNKRLLQKNGIQVGPKLSLDELLAAGKKLREAGLPLLAVGNSETWETIEIFENTLLAVVGPQGWDDLFGGRTSFDDPAVKQAAALYAHFLQYQEPHRTRMSWDDAVREMMEGRAACTVMGDWAYGELTQAGLKENEDFGWVAFPGTEGSFVVVADGFTMAKSAPHPAAAVAWLQLVGSREAQEAFSAHKGCIPARTDIDRSKLTAYLQWSADAFAQDNLVLSCAHGEAAPVDFQRALDDAIIAFNADQNAERFTAALARAGQQSFAR